MSLQPDLEVFYNSGPKVIQVSFLADGSAFDLTGLTPKLAIGANLYSLPLTDNAPVVITGSIDGPAADGVALFSLTPAHTVTLGIGRFMAQAEAGNGSTTNHKAAPFILEISRGVRNLGPVAS